MSRKRRLTATKQSPPLTKGGLSCFTADVLKANFFIQSAGERDSAEGKGMNAALLLDPCFVAVANCLLF